MAAKRIKSKKPPLTFLDAAIYWAIIFVGICLIPIGIALLWRLFICVAQTEPDVIAYSKNASLFFFLPLGVIIPLTITILAGNGIKAKQPIFLVKKVRTIGLQPLHKTHPLFSQAFRDNLTEKKRAELRKNVHTWLILFSISLLLMPWGLFPRETLDANDCFTKYNAFNQVTDTHHISEAEKLCIDIRVGRKTGQICMNFVFEEHTYTLEVCSNIVEIDDDFIAMDRAEELEYLLHLKSYFKEGSYEISGLEDLPYVTGYPEDDLVYELFDYASE